MDARILRDIGLSEGETKVYFALLELGSTKTGPLALRAGVSSSKVYKILGRLEKKGLVGHALKGKVKFFSANEPRRILDFIEEKERQLQERRESVELLIPEFEKQRAAAGQASAALFEGQNGIKCFFKNILSELKAGESYFVIGATYGAGDEAARREFFSAFHARRAKKKIIVKMLANFDQKGRLVKTTAQHSEIRYLPQYLVTNMEIVFYKNKVFIALLTQEPVGLLIESEEAVKGFQQYFNAFWKIARP